jgi:hypothetical protein
VELSPGATTGMAIGAEVSQAQPAAIVTGGMRAEMPRGVNRTGAAVGRRSRSGPHRGLWRGVRRFLRAQGTMGLVGETRKRLGLLGALTSRPDGLGGRSLCRSTSAGLGSVQHDTQPQESQDRQLVEKKVWNHGTTPSLGGEMGGLYLMLGPMELSAARRYTPQRDR